MHDTAISARLLAATLIIGLVPLAPRTISAETNPAHSIADKFAKEAAKPTEDAKRKAAEEKRRAEALKKKREEERRTAEEREMLTEAQREAEQRRAALEKARVEQEAAELAAVQRKAEEDRVIADAKAAEEVKRLEAARIADEKRIAAEKTAEEAKRIAELKAAEEQRKLADEKAAHEARRLAEAKAAEERAAAERIADALRTAEAKHSEERRLAEFRELEDKKTEASRQAALASEREAEGQRIADRLRQARFERDQKTTEIKTGALPETVTFPAPGQTVAATKQKELQQHAAPDSSFSGRVTVLLLLEPGNRGIRRHNKTADPLLCTESGCYVSNGADADATFMPGRKALGLGRTFGERAGACRQSLGCIFRGVEIGSLPGMLQPIDMRVMRHDRREAQRIEQLADCRQIAGRLACRTTIQASNYTMWVVPESVATEAGSSALEHALADGLSGSDHASLGNDARQQ